MGTGGRAPRVGDDLPALRQDGLRIVGQQADEVLAIAARGVRARERAAAEEVLALGDDPVHAEIDGRHRAVGVLPDDDESLLGAQHVHRLGAVGRDAVLRAGRHQRFPDVPRLVGADVDLVGELAGEADPHHARRHAGGGSLARRP